MTVVAVVSLTTRGEEVVLEAARRAEASDAELHVVYALGLSWLSNLEIRLFDRLGFSTGIDRIRDVCERMADGIAAPLVEDYVAAGLVGEPEAEIFRYARMVGAECVVVDGSANWNVDLISTVRDPAKSFRDADITVVPV